MAASLAAGTALATFAPAAAQEASQAPEDAQPLTVESTAHWTYPVSDALPRTLTSEFPPGVVCIVAPQLCPEDLAPVGELVTGAVGTVTENEPNPPADPLQPGDLPVGVVGGAEHYEAALKFETPAVPSEHEVDSFVLVLEQTQPTFHTSSPAFRQAVLATLTCARECDEDQFNKIMEKQPVESAVLGVEVCPFTEPFDEGASQSPPDDQPVDCIFGANAEPLDDGTWLVDLTFTAQAWQSGELENHGVLLRSTGAPNLAYGDPDPTTSAQVTFSPAVAAASSSSPGRSAGTTGTGGTGTSGFGGDTGSSTTGSSSESGFASAPSGGVSSESFSPPASSTPEESAAAPQIAEPPVATGDGQNTGSETAPVAGVLDETDSAGSAWWMWLLVPLFAAGSWMTAQSLTAEATLGSTRERTGAMSRLVASNAAARGDAAPMTQV